jgi:hypothetical protein
MPSRFLKALSPDCFNLKCPKCQTENPERKYMPMMDKKNTLAGELPQNEAASI